MLQFLAVWIRRHTYKSFRFLARGGGTKRARRKSFGSLSWPAAQAPDSRLCCRRYPWVTLGGKAVTFRTTGHLLALAFAAFGVLLLARPVRAIPISSITIDDTLLNNTIQVIWSDANLTSAAFSPNCTETLSSTTTLGSANCTEPSLTFTVDDNSTVGSGNHTAEVNFYEADGITLSDTLFLTSTDTTACPTCTPTVHAILTFQSGPGLTRLRAGLALTFSICQRAPFRRCSATIKQTLSGSRLPPLCPSQRRCSCSAPDCSA